MTLEISIKQFKQSEVKKDKEQVLKDRELHNEFLKGYRKAQEDVLRMIQNAINTSGFVGIGEWRETKDYEMMIDCLVKLQSKIKEGEKKT